MMRGHDLTMSSDRDEVKTDRDEIRLPDNVR